MMEKLSLDKFEEAYERVQEVVLPTNLVQSDFFSQMTGNKVYFKPENLQLTGAYKIRGAYYKISTLSDEEKAKGLEENIVAIDGIATITNKSNKVTNLTKDQLAKIYTGQITNWKDLGGQDEAIVVIGREAGSGTRGAFEELLGIEDQCQYAQELNETGAVLAKVAKTSGSIGYVSLDVLDDAVSPLQLDGVEPSEKTVKDGSYALQRPFVMATNGKISEQSKQVQAVFDFINSDDGQKIIEKVGLVTPNK